MKNKYLSPELELIRFPDVITASGEIPQGQEEGIGDGQAGEI